MIAIVFISYFLSLCMPLQFFQDDCDEDYLEGDLLALHPLTLFFPQLLLI